MEIKLVGQLMNSKYYPIKRIVADALMLSVQELTPRVTTQIHHTLDELGYDSIDVLSV